MTQLNLSITDRVLMELERGESVTALDVATRIGTSTQNFHKSVSRLRDEGYVIVAKNLKKPRGAPQPGRARPVALTYSLVVE